MTNCSLMKSKGKQNVICYNGDLFEAKCSRNYKCNIKQTENEHAMKFIIYKQKERNQRQRIKHACKEKYGNVNNIQLLGFYSVNMV